MPKAVGKSAQREESPETLKGWKAIGEYLGIGEATAQRWAKSGMPVRREGRFTVASADEIRQWLGQTGTATLLPDDDPHARQRWLASQHPGSFTNALVVRMFGTNLLTIRIDLDPTT